MLGICKSVKLPITLTVTLLMVLSFDLSAARLKKNLADNNLKMLEKLMVERVTILKEISKEVNIYNSESDPLFKKDYFSRPAGFVIQRNLGFTYDKSLRIFTGNVYGIDRLSKRTYDRKHASVEVVEGRFSSNKRKILGIDMYSSAAKVFRVETVIDLDDMFVGSVNGLRSVPNKTLKGLKFSIDEYISSNETYQKSRQSIHHESVALANNLAKVYMECSESSGRCKKSNKIIKPDDIFSRLELESRYVQFYLDISGVMPKKEIESSSWHVGEMIGSLLDNGKAEKTSPPVGLEETPICIVTTKNITYKGALCFSQFDIESGKLVKYGHFYPREYDLLVKNRNIFERLTANEREIYHKMSQFNEYKIKELEQKELQGHGDVDVSDGI